MQRDISYFIGLVGSARAMQFCCGWMPFGHAAWLTLVSCPGTLGRMCCLAKKTFIDSNRCDMKSDVKP